VADAEADFVQVRTDNADLNAIKAGRWDRNRALIEAMDENDNENTSPQKSVIAEITTLASGRKQLQNVWTGFADEVDATTFAKAFVSAPDQPTVSAYLVSKDIRTKIEILNNDDTTATLLHDNTQLAVKTHVQTAENLADPFFIEE
tara:strand:- start:157 stop:594 length:438 start_codon:yes stop_codon:yes gene_type:complete